MARIWTQHPANRSEAGSGFRCVRYSATMSVTMSMRIVKRRRYACYRAALSVTASAFPMTDETAVWLDITPVGREFGSPDYERATPVDAFASISEDPRRVSDARLK